MLEVDGASQDVLNRIVKRGISLPRIPEVGAELIAIVRQPVDDIDIGVVAKLVERDAGLTARLLQLANSPFFGVRRRVTSIRQAIALIGLGEAILHLNYQLFANTIPAFRAIGSFSSRQFWAHSWACATAAKMLGKPQYFNRSAPGDLYLAGLLHDVGKAVLALHKPSEFAASVRLAEEKNIALDAAEREVLGVDHAMLGGHLLSLWNLPRHIAMAAAFHHRPEEAEEEDRELAALIQFADTAAAQAGSGGSSPSVRPLSECWIVQQGGVALAQEATQAQLLRELEVELDQKSGIVTLDEETAQPEARAHSPVSQPSLVPEPVTVAVASAPSHVVPKTVKPRWQRLFGGLFSK